MNERIRHVVIGANRDPFDPLRAQIMTMDEIEHDAHARMRERAAGMRLDRDAGEGEGPRIAEPPIDRLGAIATARGTEKSTLGLQSVRRCSKAKRRHLRRDYAAFGGASRMKRLGHGAEVFAQSGGLRGAQAQCAARGFAIETEELRGARGSADRAAGRSAVEAVLIVARQDRLGDLAFDLYPDLIGGHQLTAALPIPFGERQHRRQRRCRRMGEQAIDAILGHGELGVVIVIGVNGNSVGERREACWQAHIASDHGAADHAAATFGCNAQRCKVATSDVAGLRRRAGERQADTIEHRTLAEVGHVGGHVLCARGYDEAGNVVRKRQIVGSGGCGWRDGHGKASSP